MSRKWCDVRNSFSVSMKYSGSYKGPVGAGVLADYGIEFKINKDGSLGLLKVRHRKKVEFESKEGRRIPLTYAAEAKDCKKHDYRLGWELKGEILKHFPKHVSKPSIYARYSKNTDLKKWFYFRAYKIWHYFELAETPLTRPKMLDSFEHVVVLMLENRSFDNLLGYMYPDGVPADAPLGKKFEGVVGKDLSNPIPDDVRYKPSSGAMSIPVSPTDDYFQPFPDPGEEYSHINTQLFDYIKGGNKKPYNLPRPVPPKPAMTGFVKDYIENSKTTQRKADPTYDQYKAIMQCFDRSAVPVITTLAEEFAVFDHWFASVPSQTWCNRAFWNAGTSWGRVNNGPSTQWVKDSAGTTIFNQIQDSGRRSPLNWKVYFSSPLSKYVPYLSVTGLVHSLALAPYHVYPARHFLDLEQFFKDCEKGKLPSYSFLEPRFFNPHDDMHPSTWGSSGNIWGPGRVGSVLLGELLIWKVYNAVKNSASSKGNNWKNTLLIITFDEHGGCFDHVPPPANVTPPNLSGYTKEQDFAFTRLGLRVPMVMVSAHIARNTVVNKPMDHCSFLKTMQLKWSKDAPGKFPSLSPRQDAASDFSEVFTSTVTRPKSQWPKIRKPSVPRALYEMDFSDAPLNGMQKSIVKGVEVFLRETEKTGSKAGHIRTHGEAVQYLRSVADAFKKPRRKVSRPRG